MLFSSFGNFFLEERIIMGDGVGKMRAVDMHILNRVSLAAAQQVQRLLLLCCKADESKRNVDLGYFSLASFFKLVRQGEEADEPTVNLGQWLICEFLRVHSFIVDVVPELEVDVPLVGLGELFQHGLQPVHVPLELAVHVELLQVGQLLLQLLPVIQSTSHVDVHDATGVSHSGVGKVFLEGVHNDGRRHDE
jgi:hypothetical protein